MNTQLSLLERCREFINGQKIQGSWDLLKEVEAAIVSERNSIAAERSKEQVINQYEQAIDDELVNSFLGTKDDFKDAKSALLAIIDWNWKVASDPSVSPEAAKLLEQAKPLNAARMPCGTVVTNVYEAWEAGKNIAPEKPIDKLQQEPIYKVTVIDNAHPNGIPLEQWFASPQPLKPLSDEEIEDIHETITHQHDLAGDEIIAFARAIEAKLGVGK